jgi:hypothetical protein
MNRERAFPRVPTPAWARTFLLAPAWPFPDPGRKASSEIRRAALDVLRTTARDWGLAAGR